MHIVGFLIQWLSSNSLPFSSEMECRKHVFDGYFYDHKTNMCISLNSGQHITQSDAAAACARQSAHLVNIDSRERTSFVLTWIFSNRCKFMSVVANL